MLDLAAWRQQLRVTWQGELGAHGRLFPLSFKMRRARRHLTFLDWVLHGHGAMGFANCGLQAAKVETRRRLGSQLCQGLRLLWPLWVRASAFPQLKWSLGRHS